MHCTSSAHCCYTMSSRIKHIWQTTCANRRHCLAKSCLQLCMYYSTAQHCFTQSNQIKHIHMNNYPCKTAIYRREKDSDEREYHAELRQKWDFIVNEANALHNDLVLFRAPLVDHISLTMVRRNMDQCRRAMAKIQKENNLHISHATTCRRAGCHNQLATHTSRM